jgi:hypothetical protein
MKVDSSKRLAANYSLINLQKYYAIIYCFSGFISSIVLLEQQIKPEGDTAYLFESIHQNDIFFTRGAL